MADSIKFTEEELEKVTKLQNGYLESQAKFGQITISRLNLRIQADDLS